MDCKLRSLQHDWLDVRQFRQAVSERWLFFTFRFFWLYITRDLYLFRMDWDMCAMTLWFCGANRQPMLRGLCFTDFYLCLPMYMYAYIHTDTHTHMRVRVRVNVCVYIYLYIFRNHFGFWIGSWLERWLKIWLICYGVKVKLGCWVHWYQVMVQVPALTILKTPRWRAVMGWWLILIVSFVVIPSS